MKPAPFKYFAPHSLEEALELKKEHGDDAKILAGGQSLIPAMNFRLAQPSILIDLNKIDTLRKIEKQNGSVHIGAMTLQAVVEKSKLVKKHNPLLFETMPNIAHPQIRNRGTIGGSLAHADPASELPVVAYSTKARFKAKSSSAERWLEFEEFFAGMFTINLNEDEILTKIEFPDLSKNQGWAFLEIARRKGDYAMAGLAATISLDADNKINNADLVYLNVGDGPVRAEEAIGKLIGTKGSKKDFTEAARIASEKEISPFGNVHASAQFQRHLSKTLSERALAIALKRAKIS
jgi:CO/xanthine dehydrogenase FAD-binding subunit